MNETEQEEKIEEETETNPIQSVKERRETVDSFTCKDH